MRSSTALILLVLLPITAQVVFTQTRPRRVEQSTATPSPSPRSLIENSAPEGKTTDLLPAGNKLPAGKTRSDELDVVRIETNLVILPLSVTDRLGRYIPDLQKHDFHVYEEGAEQEIAYFAAVDKPFTVVLMIDTSSSVWSKLDQIRAASRVFVDQLRPDDQVMVVSFAGGLTVECEATSDRQKIRKGIEKTGKGLSTRLYDAVDKLIQKHLGRIQGRKAVVLFTDGVDASSNRATYESTLRAAEELDAIIYPIRYDTYDRASDTGGSGSGRPSIFGIPLPVPIVIGGGGGSGGAGSSKSAYDRGERYLHELAELTAGRYYDANRDLRNLQDAFSHIAEELRRQYSLGYYPKQTGQAGQRRRIKVRVGRPDLAVRTRDSYVFKGTPGVTGTPSTTTAPDKGPSSPTVPKKPLVSGT